MNSNGRLYEDVFLPSGMLVTFQFEPGWDNRNLVIETSDSRDGYTRLDLTRKEAKDLMMALGKMYNHMEDDDG